MIAELVAFVGPEYVGDTPKAVICRVNRQTAKEEANHHRILVTCSLTKAFSTLAVSAEHSSSGVTKRVLAAILNPGKSVYLLAA